MAKQQQQNEEKTIYTQKSYCKGKSTWNDSRSKGR